MANLFGTETPANVANNDSTAYTLGTYWQSSVAGTVDKIRWRVPTNPPTGSTGFGLYRNSDQQLLQSSSQSLAGLGGTWVELTLPSPVAISASTLYTAVIFTADHYVATNSYPWPKTSGVLSTPTNAGRFNGAFSMAFPTSSFSDGCYFVDVNFTASGGGPVVTIYNGTTEVPATVTVYNGTTEVAATVELAP